MANFSPSKRPNAAKSFISFDAMLRCDRGQIDGFQMTVPAYGTSLPALPVTAPVAQEYYTNDDFQAERICSGQVLQTGDAVGILTMDALPGESAFYCTMAKRILVPLKASLTIAAGEDAYWDATDGLFTNVASTFVWVGKFLAVKETDPDLLPAGDYALLNFKQSEV